MEFLKRHFFTLFLIAGNVIVFGLNYLQAGTFDEPQWTLMLFQQGALFNPLALDKEWYRLFTHLFLHGGLLHLAFNMYALYVAGSSIESGVGPVKFLLLYFTCGLAAAFASLYWNLFTIGVGASGAIFGLFGYIIVLNIVHSVRSGTGITPVILNFVIFLVVNIVFSQAMNGDNAAHFGGLIAGAMIGLAHIVLRPGKKVIVEVGFLAMLAVVYFAMPRSQVAYYKMFQQVLQLERAGSGIYNKSVSNAEFLAFFKQQEMRWDSARMSLDSLDNLPAKLHTDTMVLRRLIGLAQLESRYRVQMIEKESYVYFDSIEIVKDSLNALPRLAYVLNFDLPEGEPPEPDSTENNPPGELTKVLYDRDWIEIDFPPAAYYRIGYRDSLGRWQGPLRDYYANGDVQMKGTYRDDKKEGVFLYYSDHKTYTSAGRYVDDQSVGKWETYHNNGKLESEVYYDQGYFLKNLWDSAGNLIVSDGKGRHVTRHPNGVVASEGEYRDGKKHGYWYGRHPNGEMYFEENYNSGRLVSGRSRTTDGKTFVYDESSFFPIPEGGHNKLSNYLAEQTARYPAVERGTVRVSFRVTEKSVLTDFTVERGLSRQANEIAKEIIKNGPRWIPAREHGHKAVDGFAFVSVVFE